VFAFNSKGVTPKRMRFLGPTNLPPGFPRVARLRRIHSSTRGQGRAIKATTEASTSSLPYLGLLMARRVLSFGRSDSQAWESADAGLAPEANAVM
jgi:hypothetical protein